MAVDATGTPTSPDNIPTYTTAADAPSGKGFNAAIAAIQTALSARWIKSMFTNTGDIAYASSASTPARLGIGSAGQVLTVSGGLPAWGAGASPTASLALNIGAANTDLSAPTGSVNYWVATTAGGTLRSIGAATAGGTKITLKNGHATSFITLKNATGGGAGAQLSIINAGDKYLAPGQTIELVYDGTVWVEVNRPASELIFDFVLAGAAATIDSNTILGGNIPAVYRHLEWVLVESVNVNSAINLRFNNDAGANYDYDYYQALAGAGGPGNALAQAQMLIGTSAVGVNYFGTSKGTVGDYRDTTHYKSVTSLHHAIQAGPGNDTQGMHGGSWRSAAAINRIQMIAGGNNFLTGSRLTLYGIT